MLAVIGSNASVRLLDTLTGETLAQFSVNGPVVHLSLSSSGLLAIAADTDGAFVIDSASGEQIHHLTGHQDGTCRVQFSPDESLLATASQDGTAKLWDLTTGDELRSFLGHAGPVCGLAFSPNGTRLATAGEDGTARVWDTVTGDELLAVAGHTSGVGSVSFDPTGDLLITASGDGFAKLWDVSPAGSHELLAVATDVPATFSAYSADGKWLATGTEYGDAAIWDAMSGERLVVLNGHTDRIVGGGFSPDGSLLVTSSEDGTARVWDAASGSELLVVTEHADKVWSSTFSPEGNIIATGGLDGLAAVWSVPDGLEIARLADVPAVFSVAFSPDGKLLAVGGIGLEIWDVATWTKLVGIEGHPGVILGAEFGPDGQSLATAAGDGSAKLWDVADVRSGTIREAALLRGHSGAVFDVVFSPDGSHMATAALDEKVVVWDDAGTPLFALPVRTPGMIAFDPTGTRLAIPSADGSVRVHVLPVDELLELVRSRLSRSFTAAECLRYLRNDDCPAA